MDSCGAPRSAGKRDDRIKSGPAHLGMSRSEGKNVKLNGGKRYHPENVTESWEKSQTVKQQVRKSIVGEFRSTNVHRKLYNAPSPAQKITRKSLAPHNIQAQSVKGTAAQRKSLKPEAKKSQTRKSFLMAPNSIRDNHVKRQLSETIKEESPASLLNNVDKSERSSENVENSSGIIEDEKNSLEETFEVEKNAKPSKSRLSLKNHSRVEGLRKNDEKSQMESEIAILRPTVIRTVMSEKKMHPLSESSPGSNDSKKSSFTLSRPVLQNLNRNSFMSQPRLDAITSSYEDLLGQSCIERGESFRASNLPINLFLDDFTAINKSLASVDQQTLVWMHANLSIAIRSTEENLFSMKHLLRTLEELRDKNSLDDETRMKNCEEKIVGETKINKRKEETEKIDEKNSDQNSAPSAPKLIIQDENSVPEATIAKSPKYFEDSFSVKERELNIFHEKSTNESLLVATPKERKKVDPRNRRSIREYMALKSKMNWLQTPDVDRVRTPKGEKDTPSHRLTNKRTLSKKLLSELNDLYTESPQ